MTLLHRAVLKLYYLLLELMLHNKEVCLKEEFSDKRNIFIYFDYEREFSGYDTSISNHNIESILEILEKKGIKSTWFTVGKIFEKYPESVKRISQHGHNIGSHTYAHVSPLKTRINLLNRDFQMFEQNVPEGVSIKGFHSPNGQWDFKLIKQYRKHAFSYDIISCKRKGNCKSFKVGAGKGKSIIRLQTLGDDWPLFRSNCSVKNAFEYFTNLLKHIDAGGVAGIGFHPWVLHSNKNILEGFKLFLGYLKEQADIQVETAEYFIENFEMVNQ